MKYPRLYRPFFWCATCAKDVDRFVLDRLVSEFGIVVVASCHGLSDTFVVWNEAIESAVDGFPSLVFFRLPSRALAPIAPPPPPKRRGRFFPAPDASRTVVWNVGAIGA